MSEYIKTNLISQNEETIYPVTKSELVITESGIPLEESINSKASNEMTVRFDGINAQGFANLSYFHPGLQEWRNVGAVASAEEDECGWVTEGPSVFNAIQNIQRDMLEVSRNGHEHVLNDITNINYITDRLTMLENNPNVGAEGPPGIDGQDGQNGTTPHIDPIDNTWRIGPVNTGVVALGRDGVDFTSRWSGQRFISLGSTITWQNSQFMNGQTIIGYQQTLVDQLDFVSFNTIAQENLTIEELIIFARNANYTQYNLAIIEIGIFDYINNTEIEDFENNLNELINIIKLSNPIIPIIIFTPMQFLNIFEENEIELTLLNYVKSIFKISNNYAIPVCDLYHNSGITPATLTSFSIGENRLNNAGFNRISMNIVGAIHMFNGSSSITLPESEEEEEEEEIINPITIMPQIDGDAAEVLQSILEKGKNYPQIIIFPDGEWSISSINLYSDITLLMSKNTIITNATNNEYMLIAEDVKNINIINGSFDTGHLCDFNLVKNISFQNVYNNRGSLKFKNVSNLNISGHMVETTTPIIFENCNEIKLNNITFKQCNYIVSLIKLLNCKNVDIDNLFDFNMERTNVSSAVIQISQFCSHIRIGNNIDLGFQEILNTSYELGNVIHKGRYVNLWTGQAVFNDFMILSFPINDFRNICLHTECGLIIPIDFRENRYIYQNHVRDEEYMFLREFTFLLNGNQVIHFERQSCVFIVSKIRSVKNDEIKKENFDENIDEDIEHPDDPDDNEWPEIPDQPDIEWPDDEEEEEDVDEEVEQEEEFIVPKSPQLKIIKITGERIKF